MTDFVAKSSGPLGQFKLQHVRKSRSLALHKGVVERQLKKQKSEENLFEGRSKIIWF